MLSLAAREVNGPRWVAASAENLPLRVRSVDVVMMLGVIGYVSDAAATLGQIRELLHPAGRLIVSWRSPKPPALTSVGAAVSALPDRLYAGMKRRLGGRIDRIHDAGGFYEQFGRVWLPDDFVRLLEGSGFHVLERRAHDFGVFRFVGRALWPEGVDLRLNRLLERWVQGTVFRPIAMRARCYLALATPCPR